MKFGEITTITLQKRVMRTVYGVGRLEYTNYLFYDSHSLKFPDIVELKTVLFMSNAYHIKLPNNASSFNAQHTSIYTIRCKNKYEGNDCFHLWCKIMEFTSYIYH